MAYQYNGTVRDIEEAPVPTRNILGKFDPGACGSYAGYRRHIRYKVPVCVECREAQASYDRDYTERCGGRPKLGPRAFQPEKCGTTAGYWQHKRYDNNPCPECFEAYRQYMTDWKERRKK